MHWYQHDQCGSYCTCAVYAFQEKSPTLQKLERTLDLDLGSDDEDETSLDKNHLPDTVTVDSNDNLPNGIEGKKGRRGYCLQWLMELGNFQVFVYGSCVIQTSDTCDMYCI